MMMRPRTHPHSLQTLVGSPAGARQHDIFGHGKLMLYVLTLHVG